MLERRERDRYDFIAGYIWRRSPDVDQVQVRHLLPTCLLNHLIDLCVCVIVSKSFQVSACPGLEHCN